MVKQIKTREEADKAIEKFDREMRILIPLGILVLFVISFFGAFHK